MTILTDGVTTLNLPLSLEWTDEFDFSPVTQDTQRTIGGGFIVQESALTNGQPITLQGGEDVWMDRSMFKDIQTLASVAGKELTLTLTDNRVFTVIFNRSNGNPFSSVPLWRKNIQENTDKVKRVVLKFYTI
tara:strand:+ start:606 stop:1001 length:396 start_codon:yes stop_codon:yes gene_type:complete